MGLSYAAGHRLLNLSVRHISGGVVKMGSRFGLKAEFWERGGSVKGQIGATQDTRSSRGG